MIDKRHIGWRSPKAHVPIELGQLRLFAKAVGERNPIYTEPDAARAAGHPDVLAPPTFAFSISLMGQSAPTYLDVMGVDIGRILHGEQSFEYYAPIYAGDVIGVSTEIADIYDKKGGALEFIVTHTDAVNQHGALCVRQKSVIVVRNG